MTATAQDARTLPATGWTRADGHIVCQAGSHRIELQPMPDDGKCLVRIRGTQDTERYALHVCGRPVTLRSSLDYPGYLIAILDEIAPVLTGKPMSLVITAA
jgi:hypothetical protein